MSQRPKLLDRKRKEQHFCKETIKERRDWAFFLWRKWSQQLHEWTCDTNLFSYFICYFKTQNWVKLLKFSSLLLATPKDMTVQIWGTVCCLKVWSAFLLSWLTVITEFCQSTKKITKKFCSFWKKLWLSAKVGHHFLLLLILLGQWWC